MNIRKMLILTKRFLFHYLPPSKFLPAAGQHV